MKIEWKNESDEGSLGSAELKGNLSMERPSIKWPPVLRRMRYQKEQKPGTP